MKKCTIPFNQLYLHSSGEVYPCNFLQNDTNYSLGNIKEKTIGEIWNSIKLRDFRENHESINDKIKCAQNQTKYFCNFVCHQDIYSNDNTLKKLDIMLDSTCNLKCIMCTNIYDERGGFDSSFFWDNNLDTLKSIKEIELVGGEPVISPFFYKIFDLMREVNQSCRWKITTNLNYQINLRLQDIFKKINFDNFTISIDSLKKETFSQIRINSDFDLIMSNIPLLKSMLLPISINMVVQKQNHHELFSIYDFSIKNNFNFYPILLTHPDTYSLLKLAPFEKNTIINNYLKKNLEVKSIEIFMLIKKFYYQIPTNEIASENKLLYFENLNIFKNQINHEE